MSTEFNDLKTFAGRLLYRQLPEEYRYQDRAEEDRFGDLEAYLHGFGHMLDLMRGTLEQSYADAFAEPADNDRDIQTWLLPYLADLVGAELLAPDPEARREELANAVLWYKTKGSLLGVDSVADVISGAEAVVVEGWRRVLATPRMTLPPFTASASAAGDGDPMGLPSAPLGTPDLRYFNRAVHDPDGDNPLYRRETPQRDAEGLRLDPLVTHWRPRSWRGAPCFPGAYDDLTARTPDQRDPRIPGVGPHPRRTNIHVRPPTGFFEDGLRQVALSGANPLGLIINPPEAQRLDPAAILAARGDPMEKAPDKIIVTGNLTIPTGAHVEIHRALFTGAITLQPGARLVLHSAAARAITLPAMTEAPALEATDCLFDRLISLSGYARLVYCTVLRDTTLERLEASDCIFNGPLDGIDCTAEQSCIRFSRAPNLAVLSGCLADKVASNTADDPNFVQLWFQDGDDCVLRPASYGEPGAGVLALTSSAAIREGAEDDGEMGAYHHLYHAAQIRALRLKLERFSPFGQEVAIRYDPHMTRPPARVA